MRFQLQVPVIQRSRCGDDVTIRLSTFCLFGPATLTLDWLTTLPVSSSQSLRVYIASNMKTTCKLHCLTAVVAHAWSFHLPNSTLLSDPVSTCYHKARSEPPHCVTEAQRHDACTHPRPTLSLSPIHTTTAQLVLHQSTPRPITHPNQIIAPFASPIHVLSCTTPRKRIMHDPDGTTSVRLRSTGGRIAEMKLSAGTPMLATHYASHLTSEYHTHQRF